MPQCLLFLCSVTALSHQVFVRGKQQTGGSVPNWRGLGKKRKQGIIDTCLPLPGKIQAFSGVPPLAPGTGYVDSPRDNLQC